MSTSKLKLNPDKTEFLLIGNEQQRSKYLSMFPLELLGVKTYPANSVRNLGVIFDKNFNLRSHISAICSSCIYHIRDLRCVRCHLDLDSSKLLADALVSSRLDYCNSLLSGIAETDLPKLQRILNRLARVVTKSPPFTCSVPLLRSLHWLPVKYRVHFEICFLTYKTLQEEQPVYLRSLIAISFPSRSLRSNRGITLSIPKIKTNTGARTFSSCAPSLWSNLPLSVRSATSAATFRRRLKTYLFDLVSPPPIDTCVPYFLLMLRNDFNDFAFEDRPRCCAIGPGYVGDIGAIEIWLLDWYYRLYNSLQGFYVTPDILYWKSLFCDLLITHDTDNSCKTGDRYGNESCSLVVCVCAAVRLLHGMAWHPRWWAAVTYCTQLLPSVCFSCNSGSVMFSKTVTVKLVLLFCLD